MKRSELVRKHSNMESFQIIGLLYHYLYDNKLCFSADHIADICHSERSAIVRLTEMVHGFNWVIRELSDLCHLNKSVVKSLKKLSCFPDSFDRSFSFGEIKRKQPDLYVEYINRGANISSHLLEILSNYHKNKSTRLYNIEVDFDDFGIPTAYRYLDRMDIDRVIEEDIYHDISLFLFENHMEHLSVSIVESPYSPPSE